VQAPLFITGGFRCSPRPCIRRRGRFNGGVAPPDTEGRVLLGLSRRSGCFAAAHFTLAKTVLPGGVPEFTVGDRFEAVIDGTQGVPRRGVCAGTFALTRVK